MNTENEIFDERQSLQVIKAMIEVSQKKLKSDGILFILWGWLMFYNYVSSFVLSKIVITYSLKKGIEYFGFILAISAFAFSLYYILRERKKVQTYIGISLRYVWISLIVSLSLVNLTMFRVLHTVNFELQHPVFMILIAFAIVITGGILRYRLIVFGGIAFAILAYVASYFPLDIQKLLEAAAWFIAFIIPGHILYSKRNK